MAGRLTRLQVDELKSAAAGSYRLFSIDISLGIISDHNNSSFFIVRALISTDNGQK